VVDVAVRVALADVATARHEHTDLGAGSASGRIVRRRHQHAAARAASDRRRQWK
jgi:hypothetical protein